MTRHLREEQLALYIAGDLAEGESRGIAPHLEGCGECARAASEFREMQSFVSASLREPESLDLLQVRARVAAKLQQPRGVGSRWGWWLVATAAALALLTPALHLRHRTVSTPVLVIAPSATFPKVAAAPAVVRAERSRRTALPERTAQYRGAGPRTVTLLAGAHQPTTIRMKTEDPKVLILWQIRERSED